MLSSGLQLRRASIRAAPHDAGMGGLFGETQEWIGRRRAFSDARRVGANDLSDRRGVAPRVFSPYGRGARVGAIFLACLKPGERWLIRASSSQRFQRLRRGARSAAFAIAHGAPNLSADQRGGRSTARAKKAGAVQTQCADWIFARGGAAAFILPSLVSKAAHGNS